MATHDRLTAWRCSWEGKNALYSSSRSTLSALRRIGSTPCPPARLLDQRQRGILAIDTAGHNQITVGHSGPRRLRITADAPQNAHVAIARPDWPARGY